MNEMEIHCSDSGVTVNEDVDVENQTNTIVTFPNEKFQEVDGGASLSENGLMAMYCFRTLAKYPIIYGTNRYTTGTHKIHFQITKRGDLRSFFGIMTSNDRVSRVITTEVDNQSLYGWWGLNIFVKNGKIQRNQEKNETERNDRVTFTLKCDEHTIELQYHRTEQVLKLVVDLVNCPFPWKLVVELRSYGDCVRIVQ